MGKISDAKIMRRAAIHSPANAPPRILVVDDEPDILRLNTLVLGESGYRVDTAEDDAAAWQALHSDRYDLLITDYNMVTVTGVKLLKKLHSEDKMLPVILMSGTMHNEELDRHPGLQIRAMLFKPYTIMELLGTVERVLRATAAGACEQFAPPSNWQSRTPAV